MEDDSRAYCTWYSARHATALSGLLRQLEGLLEGLRCNVLEPSPSMTACDAFRDFCEVWSAVM